MNEKATATDKKATTRKGDEKEDSVNNSKAVLDKRIRRNLDYTVRGPLNPEEHREFSAWVMQHEAELFQS